MLITQNFEKIKKNSVNFFKSLGQSFLKFNDNEEISKRLTLLISVNNWKNWKNKKKFYHFFLKFSAIFSEI